MLLIFIFLVMGMALGYFYKNDSKIHYYAEKISMFFVYILLLFMGLSTAQNDNFIKIFTDSGRLSLFLAVFGMLGSILFTLPVSKFFKTHKTLLWSFLQYKKTKFSDNSIDKPVKDASFELHTNTELKADKQKSDLKVVLLPFACYVIGIMIKYILPDMAFLDSFVMYSLYGLLFFTGISIGRLNIVELLKRYHILIILIPFLSLIGSLLGALFVNNLFGLSKAKELLAINAGMGYYSISAIINKSLLGDQIGLIALLTNLMRETMTMLLCPFLVKVFGPLSPISTGGATSMDTCLPFIRKSTGAEYALIAFFNGVILTVVVPPLTSFIAGM